MKIFTFLIFVLVSIVIFAVSIIAQTEGKTDVALSKIASVNPKAYDDEKAGINELTLAYDKLEAELKPQIDELKVLSLELQKLQVEIENYQKILAEERKVGCYEPIIPKAKSKHNEFVEIQSRFKIKADNYKSVMEKRKSEIIMPIENKISDALKQFAKEKGYFLILDGSQSDSSALIEGEITDVTKEFIRFYNDSSEKSKDK